MDNTTPQPPRPPRASRPGFPPRIAAAALSRGSSAGTPDPKMRLRRAMILILAVVTVFAGRLLYLQGTDNGLAAAALDRRIGETKVPAERGQILDAQGRVLAQDVTRWHVTVTPKDVGEFSRTADGQEKTVTVEQAAAELGQVLQVDPQEVLASLRGDEGKPLEQRLFWYVKKDVTPEVKQQVFDLGIPWISAEKVSKRVYPFGSLAGNIVGFTNTEEALAGIEQSRDSVLRGKDGKRIFERGADGIRIATAPVQETQPEDGSSVKLTINADLQNYAQETAMTHRKKTGAEWVMITIMNAKNGKVVAMANSTTVDPNNPEGVPPEDRYNRNISEIYDPGSTAKTLFMAAVMNEGLTHPLDRFQVPYTLTLGDQTFKDSHVHGLEPFTLAGILADSSNTGTLMMGQKLTPQQRHDYLMRFGFGQKTGIELPGESQGIVLPWEKWDGRMQYTVLFGQGYSTTNLQMTESYATLANNGKRIPARIIESTIAPDGTETPEPAPAPVQAVSEEAAKNAQLLLEAVVREGGGRKAKLDAYRVGGKTGTAEAPAKDGKGFDGSTASFIAMAPLDDPQYVVNITFQRPLTSIWGEEIATPVVKDLMAQTLHTFNVPPSSTPVSDLPVRW